jgi:GGDEF domain-containing protein
MESVLSALRMAQEDRKRPVELCWGAHGTEYYLHIAVQDNTDPTWTLMHTRPIPNNIVFQHMTTDSALMLTLIGTACTGESPETAILSATSTSTSKAFGLGHNQAESNPYTQAHSTKEVQQLSTTKAAATARADTMEGNLATMQLPNLLQSISLGQMTGRLSIKGTAGSATLFFEEGELKHVTSPESRGDHALLDLLTWADGKFTFLPNERTKERTVLGRLDALLMQGVALLDQDRYLKKHGLKMDSYLVRNDPNLTEAAFESAVRQGAPHDLLAQKRFYQQIDNKSTLFNILRSNPLPRAEWVPILFNFISCNLITISDSAPFAAQIGGLPGVNIDQEVINLGIKPNLRTETGIFAYPFFLYSLELEFHRFQACAAPFLLLVMELRYRKNGETMPAPTELLRELFQRLNTIKRKIDTFGHFETLDYALVLPYTDSSAGALIGQRIIETIAAAAKDKGVDQNAIQIAIGIAGVPEDCRDLPSLIAAAKEAKARAKQTSTAVVVCKNMH